MYWPGCSESYNLKFQFPNLCINEHQMCVKIASPCQKFESSQGLWEIETKQLKLFRKNYWRWGTIGKASWFFGRNSDWIWNWHPGIPQEFQTELQQNSDRKQPTLPNEAKTCRNFLLESTRIWIPTAYHFSIYVFVLFWMNQCCSLIGSR